MTPKYETIRTVAIEERSFIEGTGPGIDKSQTEKTGRM